MGRYWLVGIPPSGHEPPDVGLTRIWKHLERSHHKQRVVNAFARELRMRNRHKSEPRRVRTSQNRASQNCHSYQFADKRAERGYYDESDVVLCVN